MSTSVTQCHPHSASTCFVGLAGSSSSASGDTAASSPASGPNPSGATAGSGPGTSGTTVGNSPATAGGTPRADSGSPTASGTQFDSSLRSPSASPASFRRLHYCPQMCPRCPLLQCCSPQTAAFAPARQSQALFFPILLLLNPKPKIYSSCCIPSHLW